MGILVLNKLAKLAQGQSKGLKGILERSGWLERCGGLECFGWPTLSPVMSTSSNFCSHFQTS